MYSDNHMYNWAYAHRSYNELMTPSLSRQSRLTRFEEAWSREIRQLPNGHLINDNSFFRSLNDNKVYLLHATLNMDEILKSGVVYASAGCLVGAIYCGQVFPTNKSNVYSMHNLTEYIVNDESANYLRSSKKHSSQKNRSLIVFEIELPEHSNIARTGINYLNLGSIHYALYNNLSYLLSDSERNQLECEIINAVKRTAPFFAHNEAIYIKRSITTDDAERYLQMLTKAIPAMPILAYIYFEVLSEYFMLAATDSYTKELADKGEFNNKLYKNMMYKLYSDMNGNFSLSQFAPTPKMIKEFLKSEQMHETNIRYDACIQYAARRVAFMIRQTCFTQDTDWMSVHYTIAHLAKSAAPLIGHMVHRILRNYGRYNDFYFYFDNMKALQVWNYWNSRDIAVPFNGTIPKGEIGINPAYPNLKYKVYAAKSIGKNTIEIGKNLPIYVSPRLVDLSMSSLRASGHYALNKKDRS